MTTQLEADDALRMVASSFGLSFQGLDKASLLRTIESFLVECHQNDKSPAIVDEVQNMPFSALEELRMLSNLQHNEQPLFQCFLVGQPQFKGILAREDLEQLRQRVIASCHLEPLDEEECRTYIEHRLKTVDWAGDPKIDDSAFTVIYRYSNGVPRRINTLCSRLMLHGFLEDLHHFDDQVVMDVVQELAVERGQLAPETKPPAETMTIDEPEPAHEAHATAGSSVAQTPLHIRLRPSLARPSSKLRRPDPSPSPNSRSKVSVAPDGPRVRHCGSRSLCPIRATPIRSTP